MIFFDKRRILKSFLSFFAHFMLELENPFKYKEHFYIPSFFNSSNLGLENKKMFFTVVGRYFVHWIRIQEARIRTGTGFKTTFWIWKSTKKHCLTSMVSPSSISRDLGVSLSLIRVPSKENRIVWKFMKN